jgi:hypothetical protein
MHKVGSLPSGRVMLSQALERYYGPLRLPLWPATTSDLPYTSPLAALTCHRTGSPALGPINFHHMPPLLPRKTRWDALVFSSHQQRPSPSDHRVGIFDFVTRLPLGSLALRPAVLHAWNSRPSVTRTPLQGTTKVYEQLLRRDLNPQVNQPVTAYGQVLQSNIWARRSPQRHGPTRSGVTREGGSCFLPPRLGEDGRRENDSGALDAPLLPA